MLASRLRSSDGFITFVVGMAVFTDMLLYGLIVPMLPYALSDRVGIAQDDVQRWNSILLGSFGAALMLGSCMSHHLFRLVECSFLTTITSALCNLNISMICFQIRNNGSGLELSMTKVDEPMMDILITAYSSGRRMDR